LAVLGEAAMVAGVLLLLTNEGKMPTPILVQVVAVVLLTAGTSGLAVMVVRVWLLSVT